VIIITGSSGRIGSQLAERLADRYRVIAFDRRPSACARAASECVAADVTDDESLRTALAHVRDRYGAELASVIHLAGYYDFSNQGDPRHEEVNVEGTRRLFRALQQFDVGQFIYSSTMLVHRPGVPGSVINEESPLNRETDWGYPRSKLEAEDVIRAERGDIPVVLARIGAAYDEACRHIMLAHHIQRIYEQQFEAHLFPGDPAHGMTYIHMDDLVEALAQIVERRAALPPELTLLLGEGESVSYGEIQAELGRLLHGKEWETQVVPPALAKAGAWVQDHLPIGGESFIKPWMIDHADDHYAIDSTRARRLLGWEPRHTLRETLPRMVDALKRDPRGWYEENGLEPSARMK
jgi:nucleoside-diphosphate-sugar epimerase